MYESRVDGMEYFFEVECETNDVSALLTHSRANHSVAVANIVTAT